MKALTVLTVLTVIGMLSTGVADARTARAELKNAEGKVVGEATLEQKGNDVVVRATFTGLPAGPRAFHVHEVGKCEPPFETAGGHFNPTGKKHGKDNPQGPHAGDLPTVQAAANGQAKVEATLRGVSLDGGSKGLLDGDGAALVVHAAPDDNKSDPAGKAGDRIACGVIRR
jgi:Cu-Zn family superoxide dismutase